MPRDKKPRTELDAKFLAIVDDLMHKKGITKDAAISRELGRSNEFINRVRNGIQSATPEAWSTLFDKYPEARDISGNVSHSTIAAYGGGQAVGLVQGNNIYAPTTLEACQLELEQHKRDLAGVRAELEKAQQQIAAQATLLESKDALIAAKDETISLLRGGYNRPN